MNQEENPVVEISAKDEDNPEIVNRRLSNIMGYKYMMSSGGVRSYSGPLGDWHNGIPNFMENPNLSRCALGMVNQVNSGASLQFIFHLKEILTEMKMLPIPNNENVSDEIIENAVIFVCLAATPAIMARALFRTLKCEGNEKFDYDDGRFYR